MAVGVVLLLLLALSLYASGEPQRQRILPNDRVDVRDDACEYLLTAASNNIYTFKSFGGENVRAELFTLEEGEYVAGGEGFDFDARLIADKQYVLRVTGGEGAKLEVMRAALGRSFDRPIELDGRISSYAKAIARAYDAHWYRFTAQEDGEYFIKTQSDIDTVGYLLDEYGQELCFSDDAYPAYETDMAMRVSLRAGQVCLLRICAKAEETGTYKLSILTPGTLVEPERIAMRETDIQLKENGEYALIADVYPADTESGVSWLSTDPSVATVNHLGVVAAQRAGEAEIIAYTQPGVEARCRVIVEAVRVTEVSFVDAPTELPRKSSVQLQWQVEPKNASDSSVRFESSNPSVAAVDENGMVQALSEGSTVLRVVTRDGEYSARLELRVTQPLPLYRALVLGEQRYTSPDRSARVGAVNTAQGVADLLKQQSYEGQTFSVTMRLDSTYREFMEALGETFENAEPTDISLLYMNCHGGFSGGNAWLELHDGTRITPIQLEKALRRIPGRIILMVDCCDSGGFISRDAARSFNNAMVQSFARGAGTSFIQGKYMLLTSAAASQDSYRTHPQDDASEASTATLFARSLCEAGGWDLIKDRATSMRADVDKNRSVSLYETFLYVRRRVRKYIGESGVEQDVQMYATDRDFLIFDR